MHTGKVKKFIHERGFGFISATDGREIFFHQSALNNIEPGSLNPGLEIQFDVEKSLKGPRALNISILQKEEAEG